MLTKSVLMYAPHTAPSTNNDKAVQTEDRMSSLDFPTPPPAISDVYECSEQTPDEYLSLKVVHLFLFFCVCPSSFTAHPCSHTLLVPLSLNHFLSTGVGQSGEEGKCKGHGSKL